jgi:cation:H+ antiporter
MNLLWASVFLVAGLLILLKGAGFLVDGAVALAERFGISPLIIGLTVVAMGTSAPEVAASITAAARGFGDTAIGNVYGSNIANLALIGGLCALITPITVRPGVIRMEMPIMLFVALLLWPILALDSFLTRDESLLLLILFAAMLIFTVYNGLHQAKQHPEDEQHASVHLTHAKRSLPVNLLFVILGLICLAAGADLAIRGAVRLGDFAGLSKAVIGLTIMAIGTSLPELATCLVATFKGHDDISIGNLVGSNVFNTLLVVGAAGAIKPFSVSSRLIGVDYWVMIAVSAAFLIIAAITKRIGRLPGLALLVGYIVYLVYLLAITRGI